jgi:predicted ATPase
LLVYCDLPRGGAKLKITKFVFSDSTWSFSPIVFHDHLNLFVGESGSGKTRLLNVLFNIANFAYKNERFCAGNWELSFSHKGKSYQWKYRGESDSNANKISLETLIELGAGGEELLISRSENDLMFKGKPVPKLSSSTSAINLFKEEESIVSVHEALSNVMRRNFFGDDLAIATSFQGLPSQLLKKSASIKLEDIYREDLSLPNKLFLLDIYVPELFALIVDHFKRVFPFVEKITFKKAANLPIAGDTMVLFLTEKNVGMPVSLHDISSGMQKVLLILTDVVVSPPEVLYMIDEYENSLGINAINFLPPFLAECGKDKQFIITTHHPSLINAIPVDNWFVFNRKGTNIRIKQGSELAAKYSRSKQEKFIQLLTDPFFIEGED